MESGGQNGDNGGQGRMAKLERLLSRSWCAAIIFAALAVVMTWPLAAKLGSGIAGDLGDPLLNCWIMMWTGGQVLRFFRGDWGALSEYWNGNIFYPERLTVAYSEHLAPQMLQALPIYAITGNIVLAYNLVLLSTIALSGFAAYLLVRELTGRGLPALLAGVAFAFAPYRADQLSHLQVLSSYWMPLSLLGLRRYFSAAQETAGTNSSRSLAGGFGAAIAQALSCGYYVFYFLPVLAGYCVYELASRHLLRNRRVVVRVAAGWLVVLVVLVAFLWPYEQLRSTAGLGRRNLAEVQSFSADVYAFASLSADLRHRAFNLFPKPEGFAFPGFAALAFGLVALVGWRHTDARRASFLFWTAALIATSLLAMGPAIQIKGHSLAMGPYRVLYDYAPGFDGLRVPARFLMIGSLCIAILAGIGASLLQLRFNRLGSVLIAAGIFAVLFEGWVVPLRMSRTGAGEHYRAPPRDLPTSSTLGPIYELVRDLPQGTVLVEFPFGEPMHDVRSVFMSGFHRKPLLNGYSGFFPLSFSERASWLTAVPTDKSGAWKTILASGATHAIVHEGAFHETRGRDLSDWLRQFGARELLVNGRDYLFDLKPQRLPQRP